MVRNTATFCKERTTTSNHLPFFIQRVGSPFRVVRNNSHSNAFTDEFWLLQVGIVFRKIYATSENITDRVRNKPVNLTFAASSLACSFSRAVKSSFTCRIASSIFESWAALINGTRFVNQKLSFSTPDMYLSAGNASPARANYGLQTGRTRVLEAGKC